MIEKNSMVLRPSLRPAISMTLVMLPLIILGGLVWKADAFDWQPIAFPVAFLAVWYSWLASTRLKITPDSLVYRTFWQKKSIRLTDIEKAELVPVTVFGRPIPNLFLIVSPKGEARSGTLKVALRIFGGADLKSFLKLLEAQIGRPIEKRDRVN